MRNRKITNKKAFTLIELLAVIVILAIIALIAVPVIINIINKVNKSAFKDTAYGIINAGELYFAEQQLEPMGMTDSKTFEFPNTGNELQIKGKLPDSGYMTVNKDGKVAIAVSNGRYCITKDFDDTDVTVTEDYETCELATTKIAIGDPVYFNPKDNVICPDDYEPENSLMGVKDECMRWYVYKIEGDKLGLILDHNTTAMTKWNETGNNVDGPTTLEAQLDADTTNWQVEADIIEAEDILTQLKFYQDLEDKTTWESQYMTDMESASNTIMPKIEQNASNYANMLEMYKAVTNMLMTDYSDIALPSYLHEDLYSNCSEDGSCTTYGYWTKTAIASGSNQAWIVHYTSIMGNYFVDSGAHNGLRPVITITASQLGNVILPGENNTTTEKTLSELATTSTEVPSIPGCITNNTTCTAGTPVAIKVNKSETYNFYVISETDNKVTLIMDSNLGDNVGWMISEDSCKIVEQSYSNGNKIIARPMAALFSCTDEGPITAVAALKERTSGWTNIPEKEYTYSDDGGGNKYTAFTETMRARMLTYTEATTTLGCTNTSGSCPSWLYINLYTTGSDTDSAGDNKYGYWTSAAYASDTGSAHYIVCDGYVNDYYGASTSGLRPVIELTK